MATTAELFVLGYLRDKVGAWASGQWATPAGTRVKITQALQADDRLCLEIFAGVMSVCASGHEKDVFDQLRAVLDHIHILLVQGATSTSAAWRECYAQTILWRQRVGPPAEPQHLQLFVLGYLRDKVGEWAHGEWATPRGHQDQVMQELQADDGLCMEIFEGVMLMCETRFREIDFFYKLRNVLDYIHVLLAEGATGTSEAWRHMKSEVQSVLWYNYVDALRHHKECSPGEGGSAAQRSRAPSAAADVLVLMRARLSNV